jgi:predicted ATPase/class 3 adenylate cyclase
MQSLPDGVVTFLFTDVEGSTRLWEDAPDTMMAALRQHDRAIEDAAFGHDGVPVRPRGEGDSRFVVFATPIDAVAAAAEMQRALATMDWPTPRPLRVRASLHTGDADLQLGDYYGPAVNRAARLRGIAHGGQTLLSGATWELVNDRLPAGVALTDMGRHRLKDLTRPEHVYQLDVEGLDITFPPLASLDAVPNNLPVQLTDFIGRRVELAEVKGLLGGTRMVTVLAPGGAGKTRLAIQAAADLTAGYPDGVFFVDLAPVETADAIVQAVAESLGLALSADEDVQAQLLTYLANKRQLLVFDNFEHLSDGAPIVTAILQAAPQVTVLTTSRSALRVTGETVFTLEGLESTWKDPEEALETSGAGLFVDAARRARPEFTLRPDDLESLASILRLTDGMPLGIILAAAWSSLLSVREIAAEMATSLDFLETDAGDVPDRQRSVRAVFDYTWQLLSPEEQRVFTALSVFRGGFTRAAAEAVAGASLRDLAGLAAKSLVTTDPDSGRSTIHELLRQYAEAELAADPEVHGRVLDAHAAFYSDWGGELFPPGTRLEELDALETDIDNIRRAWRHNLAIRNPEQARKLIGPLWAVYEVRGWYPSAEMLFEEALDAFDEDSGDAATEVTRALAAAFQAWFVALLGRPVEAEAATAAAVDVVRAHDDPAALWLALLPRALTLAYTGQDFSVVADEGIAIGEALGDPFLAAGFKNWRGGAALFAGDFDTARQRLVEGMAVYERIGERYWLSANLQHQAQVATAEGRTGDAVDLYGRSTDTAREIGAVRVLQMSAAGLGDANLADGNYETAEGAYVQSLATSEQMGMVHSMLSLITKIAGVRAATGHEREAIELLASVLADPASDQQAVFDSGPIGEAATATLDELRRRVPPEEFAAAEAAGAAVPYDVAAKQLIASRSSDGR